ncbi:MAG TPA: 6,7-dimethyl-8-ribityllumazine synthase [Longimicrobiales bacterium]
MGQPVDRELGAPGGVTGLRGRLEGGGARFAIVASRFNEAVTERLVEGARAALLEHGVAEEDVDTVSVPGAWELPMAVDRVVRTGRYAAVVAIGCVIRGETPHFDFIAAEAARGLAAVALTSGVPVTFGVLTTDTAEQAFARAGGEKGNKGRDAALAALELADLFRRLEESRAGA